MGSTEKNKAFVAEGRGLEEPGRIWEVDSGRWGRLKKIKHSGRRGELWESLGDSGGWGRLNKNEAFGAEGRALGESGRV